MKTAQEWLDQSSQLLQARPTTTRITTKYTLKPVKETIPAKETSTSSAQTSAARAGLTLKTYDPVTGVTLKYKTDKAAEVGRLITILSMLGRSMAGLPKMEEDIDMLSAPIDSVVKVASEQTVSSETGVKAGDGPSGSGAGQGASGKRSKKKGKR